MITIETKEERGRPITTISYQPENLRESKLGAVIDRFFTLVEKQYDDLNVDGDIFLVLSTNPEKSTILGTYAQIAKPQEVPSSAPEGAVAGGNSRAEKAKAAKDAKESEGVEIKDDYPEVPHTYTPPVPVPAKKEEPAPEAAEEPAPAPAPEKVVETPAPKKVAKKKKIDVATI